MGSPYVPLDSWIYPMIVRLLALGYIKTADLGIRPWTRMECARLLEQAADLISDDPSEEADQGRKFYLALQKEFSSETARLDGERNLDANIDSIYTRESEISGTPLRDGYHFGQTIINDFGRPYGQGFNDVSGFTSHAVDGPFAISIQGEYQHAPAVASDPPNVLQATAAADLTPVLPNGMATVDRFRLLSSTASVTVRNTSFSFGQQSDWLGVGESGPLLLSDNAAPFLMFKVDSVSPYRIPLLSALLGPLKSQNIHRSLIGQDF